MILVEGMDCVGKSTLAEGLRSALGDGVAFARNSIFSGADNPVAARADERRKEPGAGLQETGLLFLASLLQDLVVWQRKEREWDELARGGPPLGPEQHLRAPRAHVQDSWALRTLAYHTFKDNDGVHQLVEGALRQPGVPRFDVVVYLTACTASRLERLRKRRENDRDDAMIETNPRCAAAMDRHLQAVVQEFYPDAVVIDTSAMGAAEVLAEALRVIGERLPGAVGGGGRG